MGRTQKLIKTAAPPDYKLNIPTCNSLAIISRINKHVKENEEKMPSYISWRNLAAIIDPNAADLNNLMMMIQKDRDDAAVFLWRLIPVFFLVLS